MTVRLIGEQPQTVSVFNKDLKEGELNQEDPNISFKVEPLDTTISISSDPDPVQSDSNDKATVLLELIAKNTHFAEQILSSDGSVSFNPGENSSFIINNSQSLEQTFLKLGKVFSACGGFEFVCIDFSDQDEYYNLASAQQCNSGEIKYSHYKYLDLFNPSIEKLMYIHYKPMAW
eukprot:CAMPEP_0170518058 /NCGR_PEP_ID=MMETSP0209-20121228/3842_1 /TAXON_ID=665100 ORGANISM="Litonotus pictus, Strain P1" /NCGR_SAMPLE_ID=MMETSP0209 /ASSEMBLY_ACC=CAM_ASM_000301 /LENGTH=174 /DNA_ID=CAMNT_0010803483 /DNA_START=1411 /DNA_END=1932 /DNA_ORIENTATION=+